MAFDPHPSTWLGAGYTLSGSVAGFTTNTSGGTKCLTELTDTEAASATGDIREIARAFCVKMQTAYAGTASADRPTRMQIFKQNTATGETFTFVFQTTATSINVAAE